MKLSHLTIIFIIIIIPFFIVSRIKTEDYFLTLRDQVRLNNVIDSATQDALDTLIDKNDEFQMINFNERFDISQSIAKESVKSFFKTFAANFNMPYIDGQTESYFSMYVPAIVIVAYDGFYIYSIDETPTGQAYQMSPKIPYAYSYDFKDAAGNVTGSAVINFTLGNYMSILIHAGENEFNGVDYFFEGELKGDFLDEVVKEYGEFRMAYDSDGDGILTTEQKKQMIRDLPSLTNNLSLILYSLIDSYGAVTAKNFIPPFLIPKDNNGVNIPLSKDYSDCVGDDDEPSDFHKIRREVIIKLISETLREEINNHTSYAKIMGAKYDFSLPEISNDEWTNSINDISVMAFVQGMQVGTTSYYNNYALGGSRIVQTNYIYGTMDKYYHSEDCERIKPFIEGTGGFDVDNMFINRVQAAQFGYYPCLKCYP